MTQFDELYDTKEEYILRRDPQSYNAKRIALEVDRFKIPHLLEVLPDNLPCHSIAEIGCATGEIIGTFPGLQVQRRVGFDISPLNIRAAQERFPSVEFRAIDFRWTDEKFDLVILSDILEHVPDDLEFLKAAAVMGTVLLINLPLEKNLSNILRNYGPEDSSGHLRSYSFPQGMALIKDAGLTPLNHRRVWSYESKYELLRQDLSQRMLGARFSGGSIQQNLKKAIFKNLLRFKPIGRTLFPSNLFIAARKMG